MSAPSSPEAVPRVTYWTIVWTQLRKNRIAVFGLWCIGALFFVATYAPLLSFNVPILLVDEELRFPFFAALFNRLLFENAVDIFFNLLMVLLPFYTLLFWGGRRLGRGQRWARSGQLVGILGLVHLVLFASMAHRELTCAR